ncbi:hypothetical protein GCM10018953_64770 [Streptosporangium nondiastaticum]
MTAVDGKIHDTCPGAGSPAPEDHEEHLITPDRVVPAFSGDLDASAAAPLPAGGPGAGAVAGPRALPRRAAATRNIRMPRLG